MARVETGEAMKSRDELARLAAEIGAALCCYAPGHGDPDAWPTSFCDCKFGGSGVGEQTGCPEARTLHRMLTNPDVPAPWWHQ